MEGAVQQAPQPGRHCMGVDCALALRPVGWHLLCFTWNKWGLLVFFVLPCACMCVSAFSGQRGAGAEGASGRASMLAALPLAGLLSGARTGQVAAQLALRAQTCSPSPGHRPGADLPLPARLRRQQGAQPEAPSALECPALPMRRALSFAFAGSGVKRDLGNYAPGTYAALRYNLLRPPPAGRNRDVGAAGGAPCCRRAAQRRGGHVRSTCFVN